MVSVREVFVREVSRRLDPRDLNGRLNRRELPPAEVVTLIRVVQVLAQGEKLSS
jgi:hypothetical protein